MKRVVVCGAGGFIGGHLIAKLLNEGHTRVRGVDIKPLDERVQSRKSRVRSKKRSDANSDSGHSTLHSPRSTSPPPTLTA